MTLSQRIAAARVQAPADLVLTNLQLVNVLTGEIHPAEIAIKDGLIIGVGKGYRSAHLVDLEGRYVAPGLIDAHVHIESSLCTPPEFSRALLARGVTTAVTDPHEIANVHGLAGIRYMLEASQNLPLSVFIMASSCIPATHMSTAGASLDARDLETLLRNPAVLGLAEMMNFPGVINGDPGVLAKLEAFSGRVIDGHSPGLRGNDLDAYIVAGIGSDHECNTVEEAQEKLRKGMVIFIREATNAHNLRDLLPLITPTNSRRLCFCTDDRHPSDLLDQGSIDFMIRVAIAEGRIDPITAIRMGTLNAAEYFRLYDRGAIAPGRRADLFVFSDLKAPSAEEVYSGGRLVAQDGKVIVSLGGASPTRLPHSTRIQWEAVNFKIPARGSRMRVIGSVPDQLVTEHLIEDVTAVEGCVHADPQRDLLKIAVIDRHHASGSMGKGFIRGIGLKHGAIAGTVAHDHHNLLVIGADDRSMMIACRAVEHMGGGLVAVSGDTVLAQLPLPVAGLMSQSSIYDVRTGLDTLLYAAAQDLGSTLHDPFMAMSFMALEVIPSLKLTDQGLVDVDHFELVDLFV